MDSINVLKKKEFDRSRWTQLPRDIFVGHKALQQLPDIVQDINPGRRLLIVTGERTRKIAGEEVAELLSGLCETRYFVTDHLSEDVLKEGIKEAEDADFLIAVGGGRIIDTAKVISFNLHKQFISIPTAASHDGIISNRATVPTVSGSLSVAAHPPIAVVADTGIIAQAPHRLLAAGCADIISNYTAILDWELAHRLRGEKVSEYALALSRMTAEILVKKSDLIRPGQEEGAYIVVTALVSSGVAMSIAGSSRPASGGEHKFSHALERIMPGKALHGEACGIGSIMTMYLHGGDWRSIRRSLLNIGAPVTPRELGIPDDIIVEALLAAKEIRPERFTILDSGITKESAIRLVQLLYEEE